MTDLAGGLLADSATPQHTDKVPAPPPPLRQQLSSAFGTWDVATAVVLVVVLALVLTTFRSYAVSNDEWVQHHYGELIIRYYRSGFTDRALFSFDNLYLYGGLFDIAAVALHQIVPLELYDLRHLMTALIGIGGIGAAALLARHIAGARAGFLAAIGLAVSGGWYGTMFTHTKDVPLAAAMTAASYFLIRASRDLPRPKWRDVIGLGLMTGCALGIKVLALLIVVYAGAVVIVSAILQRPFSGNAIALFIGRSLLRLTPAFLIAYAIMLAAWPWAALAPLNPVRGLLQFGDFHYQISTELGGRFYEMASVPRLYIPIYLAIRNPLIVVVPVLLALLLVLTPLWKGHWFTSLRRRETGVVLFMIGFPLACEVIEHGPAFTGMRHFMFVLPLMAAVAAVSLEAVLVSLTRIHWMLAAGVGAAIMADIGWDAQILYELHPYEYLYYNPLVGGLAGASRRYDTDYWVAIMPAAVADLSSFLARKDRGNSASRTYTVDVCGERSSFERELAVQHLSGRLRWTDNWNRADFFIAPTHGNCDQVLKGRVIASIKREGAVIGVVKDRRDTLRPAVAQLDR